MSLRFGPGHIATKSKILITVTHKNGATKSAAENHGKIMPLSWLRSWTARRKVKKMVVFYRKVKSVENFCLELFILSSRENDHDEHYIQ